MRSPGPRFIYLIILFILAVVLFSISNFRNILKLREEKKYYRRKLAEVEAKNAELEQKLEWLDTEEEYIKFLARKKLGLVEPGESKVYIKMEEE